MSTLRDRCKKLLQSMVHDSNEELLLLPEFRALRNGQIDKIEAFAIEIRNEALEECIERLEYTCGLHWRDQIRSLKTEGWKDAGAQQAKWDNK